MSASLYPTLRDTQQREGLYGVTLEPYGGSRAGGDSAVHRETNRAEIIAGIVEEMSFTILLFALTVGGEGLPAVVTGPMMIARTTFTFKLIQQLMQLSFAITTNEADLVPVNSAFSYLSLTGRSIAASSAILGFDTSPIAVSTRTAIFDTTTKLFKFAQNPTAAKSQLDIVRSLDVTLGKVRAWMEKFDVSGTADDGSDLPSDTLHDSSDGMGVSASAERPPHGSPADYGLGPDDTSGDEDNDSGDTDSTKSDSSASDQPLSNSPNSMP